MRALREIVQFFCDRSQDAIARCLLREPRKLDEELERYLRIKTTVLFR
ncbi:MAG: hypothetical protein ABI895_24830 [Deltaproteobacteria bacterium]